MKCLADATFQLGTHQLRPVVTGGMGVDISTADLALESARLGAVGHISDAMVQFVSDRRYGTDFGRQKLGRFVGSRLLPNKTGVQFDLTHLRTSQMNHVGQTMARKRGDGLVFINIMEKLNMANRKETLRVRLNAALDAGIDGITLSAGLHLDSFGLMQENPRFRHAFLGIIVSSARALKIFLRSARRVDRLPDYIVVEGPLAGGHLGFGDDWADYDLRTIVQEVLALLAAESLSIPVIPAGGVFTGTDAVEMIELGAAAVQVATRFTVTRECGLPDEAKQQYFRAREEEVQVTNLSPTGYPLRMLVQSPCRTSNVRPMCERLGYVLDDKAHCAYVDAHAATGLDERGNKKNVEGVICLCHHFSKMNCWTCGHYVYRLKDTSIQEPDGSYRLLTVEHVMNDYLFSTKHEIRLPTRTPETAPA